MRPLRQQNEGIYLQGAIPYTARHGMPIHFATDPAQHHIEGSHFDRLETQMRLERGWARYFTNAPWRVEKSPVNLTRMRLHRNRAIVTACRVNLLYLRLWTH
tara:strand:- start:5974 stop:6279 length:306 start_codon:yes stop_codon:yes gene_type:complete